MSGALKRFYTDAAAIQAEGGFGVALDGRSLRTPGKLVFRVPARALAEACAAEWQAQTEEIRPHTMPLTRLANVAIERTPSTRGELAAHIAQYGETDLLCHRAETPAKLVARQAAAWDPLVTWAGAALSFRPRIVAGIRAAHNDTAPLMAAAAALDDFRLTGLAHAVGLTGSAILGFALLRGELNALAAYEAAMLDDLYQIEAWGEDSEARRRLDAAQAAIEATARFIALLA